MRIISFEPDAFEDFIEWSKTNRKIFDRINKLLQQIARTPFVGEGKPEPLKGNLKGCWSVRIDQQNRIVYIVSDRDIKLLVAEDIMINIHCAISPAKINFLKNSLPSNKQIGNNFIGNKFSVF